MQTLNNPFEPYNKVRGKYICKEVFLRRSFMRPSFLRLSACVCLYCCAVVMLHEHVNDYITDVPLNKETKPNQTVVWFQISNNNNPR